MLKNTPCTLDTPRLLVAQNYSSGDICMAHTPKFDASLNGRPRPVPDICRLPWYLAVSEKPREAANIGHWSRPAIRRRVGIKRCPLEGGQLTVTAGPHSKHVIQMPPELEL